MECDVCQVQFPSPPAYGDRGRARAPDSWLHVVVPTLTERGRTSESTTLHACDEECARKLIKRRDEKLALIRYVADDYGEIENRVALATYDCIEHGMLRSVRDCGLYEFDSDWSLSSGRVLGNSRYADALHASRLLVPAPTGGETAVGILYPKIVEYAEDFNEYPEWDAGLLSSVRAVLDAWGDTDALAEFAIIAAPYTNDMRESAEPTSRRGYERRMFALLHAADEAIGERAAKAIPAEIE